MASVLINPPCSNPSTHQPTTHLSPLSLLCFKNCKNGQTMVRRVPIALQPVHTNHTASFGTCVAPTRFVPGKTPLAQEILDNWTLDTPPKYPHTVASLIEATATRGDRIGAFLDLANHTCLYSQDLPGDVEYVQVQLVAKQLPSQQAIDRVAAAANDFWARHPTRAIAIHCAYGAVDKHGIL